MNFSKIIIVLPVFILLALLSVLFARYAQQYNRPEFKYTGVGCDMSTGMFFLDSVNQKGAGEIRLNLETTVEPKIKEDVVGKYLDSLTIWIPMAASFHQKYCSQLKNPPSIVEAREIIEFYLKKVKIKTL
jgi:hypothetical protein